MQVDIETTKYDIVQVNRDSDLLLMQSSLHTLRDQFDELKEYLPLDAVSALEFVLLYPSLFEVNPKAARRLREEIEQFCKNRRSVRSWFERFEQLHGGGNVAGLVLPYLMDMHEAVPVPNSIVRKEGVSYVEWVCANISEIKDYAKRKTTWFFQSASIRRTIALIAMGDRKWSSYGIGAVNCATHGCSRTILFALGIPHAEKAIQASAFLTGCLPSYSVTRLVLTSVAGQGRVPALYVYVDSGAPRDNEIGFREFWDAAIALDGKLVNKVRIEIARNGQCIVRNSQGELSSFLSALFEVMSNSEFRIVECSVWREGSELRLLLRVSRTARPEAS